MYKNLVIVFACFAIAFCEDPDVARRCGDNVECVEKELIKAIDSIRNEEKIEVLGNFAILEKTGGEVQSRKDGDVVDKVADFFSGYKLNLKVPTSEADFKKIISETRSSKLKKIIIPILLLLKLKAAIVIPAIISGIALVAFKGLGASLIALAISGATALKSLLENNNHSKFTYEVVPPIPHSHWSRSGMAGIESYPLPGYHTIQQLYK